MHAASQEAATVAQRQWHPTSGPLCMYCMNCTACLLCDCAVCMYVRDDDRGHSQPVSTRSSLQWFACGLPPSLASRRGPPSGRGMPCLRETKVAAALCQSKAHVCSNGNDQCQSQTLAPFLLCSYCFIQKMTLVRVCVCLTGLFPSQFLFRHTEYIRLA